MAGLRFRGLARVGGCPREGGRGYYRNIGFAVCLAGGSYSPESPPEALTPPGCPEKATLPTPGGCRFIRSRRIIEKSQYGKYPKMLLWDASSTGTSFNIPKLNKKKTREWRCLRTHVSYRGKLLIEALLKPERSTAGNSHLLLAFL